MDILYIGSCGSTDPVKAALPFHLAVNGSAARGDRPSIALAGDATDLLLGEAAESLEPLGLPPMRELVAKAVELEVPVYV
ncbi:MAG TPA: hypothetical protein VG455_10460 [Acidimicrobiales bacterium]|nr:hypothetical protein [Acidimicrobiales bacterium]